MTIREFTGCVALGVAAGVVLFFAAATAVLLYGPDTNISF